MGCNGCQELIGDAGQLQTGFSITATGLTVQEVARVTIPHLADTIELEGHVNVASAATATESIVTATLVPASNLNQLAAIDGCGHDEIPFTDVVAVGIRLSVSALLIPGEYEAGDWVLGVTRGATAAQVIATQFLKAAVWWHR